MEWYDPFEEMKRFQRHMNRFFENFGLVPAERTPTPHRYPMSFREPLADIREKGNYIIVTLEIPGVKKENIELNVTEDEISVKVEKKDSVTEKGKGFYRAERSYKGFYRSLRLPCKVNTEKATANYSDGLLTVKLPKKGKVKKVKKIEIK